MASGLVAKKIALFEPSKQPTAHVCRLKRKHAIRRKRYRRDRRLISEPDLSFTTSDEPFRRPSALYNSTTIASNLSASCSALLDLIYNKEQCPSLQMDTTKTNPALPIGGVNDKRILCRSSSLEEAFPARLNIIDIDIEIRVEKQSRSPSPRHEYEPMQPMSSISCIDKIKLFTRRDKKCSDNINNKLCSSSSATTNENYNSSTSTMSSSNSCNYFCSSCGTYNNNADNLQEHIYENFALVPPPRPPKLKPLSTFCDSSSLTNLNAMSPAIIKEIKTPKGIITTEINDKHSTADSVASCGGNNVLGSLISASSPEESNKTQAVITSGNNDAELGDTLIENEKEPFYEDLYDYCLPPDCYLAFDSVSSFVNDKDDEVEYCDCSTVMAMAINNLNSGGTVIYNSCSSSSSSITESCLLAESPSIRDNSGGEMNSECNNYFLKQNTNQGDDYTENLLAICSTNTTNTKGFFYLGCCVSEGESFSDKTKASESVRQSLMSTVDPPLTHMKNIPGQEVNVHDPPPDAVTNASQRKKDEDDLDKPLPKAPSSTYSSSNSSDSFYSEPIYGITNQITHYNSTTTTRNPGPPVPDTLRRPSLAPTPANQNVISCNNVIRNEPSSRAQTQFKNTSNANATPELRDGVLIYADSIPSQKRDGENFFEPDDKLPPIPPSKLSTMAKTAGKKLAKKFMGIRKLSKSSLESFEPSSSSCSSPPISISPLRNDVSIANASVHTQKPPTGNVNSSVAGGPSSTQSQLRRPISRPSIPPPEPPKSLYGGSSNGSANNYSIYGKSESVNRKADEDDDFDDSDFYDSDSELIRNFVSQVQPIYSMEEEPLYQYYAYGISTKPEDDYQPVIPKNLGLTLDMLVPRGGQRTLWCELSEVIGSGILSILSDKQKQLQEAIFEILTSEVSYLKSLDVLTNVFFENKELTGVLSSDERKFLFGNVEEVRECAHAFLTELLCKWDESWYIQEIGEIINRNANSRFAVYKEYCRNKPHQDKVMQRLRHTRDEFVSVLKTLEEDPRCQMLRVESFLMLPMQRITRLPLLVNAVILRTTSAKEKTHCEEALKSLTNLVLECNDAARESQDAEETFSILDKLEFRSSGLNKPLSTFGQFLMKGDFMKNPFDQGRGGNQINWTFRKNKRTMYWVLLFANQLLITKKKANGKFEVIDQSSPKETNIKPLPNLEGVSNDFQNFFMLHFDKKEAVYFLAARTNSEIDRWKSKLDSIKSAKENLRVESIFPYEPKRADELSFGVGDIIDVTQIQPDGWYYGTKVSGGRAGWFPGNYCCEL